MDPLKNILYFIDKHYRALILIGLVLFAFSFGYVLYVLYKTGYPFKRDISLTGGISIGIPINNTVNIATLETQLENKFNAEFNIKLIVNPITREPEFLLIETSNNVNTTKIIDYLKDIGVVTNEKDVTISSFSPKYGQDFYKQFLITVFIATILISLVIFWRVKNVISSVLVLSTIIFDIFCTLAVLNILGIPVGEAGIAAILMIIGYSIDNNLIVATHYLRNKDKPFVERVYRAVITATTIIATTVAAIIVLYFLVQSQVVKQIALILLISEVFDQIYLWFVNLPVYKWYTVMKQGTPEK